MKVYYTLTEACKELEVSKNDLNKAIAHLGIKYIKGNRFVKITDRSIHRLEAYFKQPYKLTKNAY